MAIVAAVTLALSVRLLAAVPEGRPPVPCALGAGSGDAGDAGEAGEACAGGFATSLLQQHAAAGRDSAKAVERKDLCDTVAVATPLGEVALRRRARDVKVVDFIQFFNQHELPELRLRLAEMAPFVDEIHIAEGTRDFAGAHRELLWPTVSRSDAAIAEHLGKITYHPVEVPPGAWGYAIQEAILAPRLRVPGRGVMVEGDLDEIVRRDVLQAMRSCEPADGRGWDANVKMTLYSFSMAWTTGDWSAPPLVRDFDHTAGAPSEGLAQAEARQYEIGDGQKHEARPYEIDHGRYIKTGPNRIVMKDERPAGWHISWTLDVAEGLAVKILHGQVEGIPWWARPHAGDMGSLVKFLRDRFLPHPDQYIPWLRRARLTWRDLPAAMRERQEEFNALLGGARVEEAPRGAE